MMTGFLCGLMIRIYQTQFKPLPDITNSPPVFSAEPEFALPTSQNDQDTIKDVNQRRININTASIVELLEIPGIGPVTAQRILEYREQNGRFKNTDALLNIKGIGPKTLQKLNQYIIIDPMKEEG